MVCNQAEVLGEIGLTIMLIMLHNSRVASDLLIDAVSKNKAAGVPLVCLIMTSNKLSNRSRVILPPLVVV